MRIEHDAPLGYSPRRLAKAFEPWINEKHLRELIRAGTIKCYTVFGNRAIILRSDIEDYIRKQPQRGI